MRSAFVCLMLSAFVSATLAQTPPAPPAPPASDRFYQAIRTNDLTALLTMARESGIDAKDSSGLTPLIMAAAFGTPEAVKLLVEAGANVNAQSDSGLTALHVAWRDEPTVRLLLSRGANVNASNATGATALLVACSATGTAAVVALLLENGAAPNAPENRGVTPLIAAAGVGNTEAAKLLLAHGADANAYASGAGQKTATPLMGAAHNGDVELTRLLLARKADVNTKSPDNDAIVKNGPVAFGTLTALHFAVAARSPEVVKLLVDAGASIDAGDVRGLTPLMWAVGTDRPEPRIIQLLVDRGANTSTASKTGESALDWARKYNEPAVMPMLKLASSHAARLESRAITVSGVNGARTPRDAVEQSLRLLRTGSSRVMSEGGCVACHAQPMTGLAVEYASGHGWSVEAATTDVSQVVKAVRDTVPNLLQGRESGGLPDNLEYNAFMMAAVKVPPGVSTDVLAYYLAAKQRPAGNWHAMGTRPPIQDGDISRTALAVRELAVYGAPARKADNAERIRRAAGWLAVQQPRSTEERVMQLLGLKWADMNLAVREKKVRELSAAQRRDGGWGQSSNLASDAYATGQVLFALRELGVPASNASIRRGVDFLLRTQAQDGSWHVTSRAMKIQPYFESGFPYDGDQWISQSGTAWAAMALAVSTLDGTTRKAAK